jgi:hypothetical protein
MNSDELLGGLEAVIAAPCSLDSTHDSRACCVGPQRSKTEVTAGNLRIQIRALKDLSCAPPCPITPQAGTPL